MTLLQGRSCQPSDILLEVLEILLTFLPIVAGKCSGRCDFTPQQSLDSTRQPRSPKKLGKQEDKRNQTWPPPVYAFRAAIM